jgi:hypothetical protein
MHDVPGISRAKIASTLAHCFAAPIELGRERDIAAATWKKISPTSTIHRTWKWLMINVAQRRM